jgi:hypothetical protein
MTVTIDGTLGITTPPTLTLQAGTATAAPLDFTSGTNLTTPVAGAVEYDGKVIYATPQGTQRGVVPGQQFFRLESNLAGANVNTAQSVFGVGVTLSASTAYAFEAMYILSKTAGSTTHTVGLGFGGTATVNNILYQASGSPNLLTLPNYDGTYLEIAVSNSTANNLSTSTAGGTTVAQTRSFMIRGTVSVNAGGTFIPQYTLSAAPGGAYSTVAGSFFSIYPIGASGANTSVGTWA